MPSKKNIAIKSRNNLRHPPQSRDRWSRSANYKNPQAPPFHIGYCASSNTPTTSRWRKPAENRDDLPNRPQAHASGSSSRVLGATLQPAGCCVPVLHCGCDCWQDVAVALVDARTAYVSLPKHTAPFGLLCGTRQSRHSRRDHTASTAIATASPPPMQSASSPRLALCNCIACSSVTNVRAPLAPIG